MLQPEAALTVFEQVCADNPIISVLRQAGMGGVATALSGQRDNHPRGRRSRTIYDEIHANLGDQLGPIGGYRDEPLGHLRWRLPEGRYSHPVQVAVCKGNRVSNRLYVSRKKHMTEEFILPNPFYVGQHILDLLPTPAFAALPVGLYLSHELSLVGWLSLYLAMPTALTDGGECLECAHVFEIFSGSILGGSSWVGEPHGPSSLPPATDVDIILEDNDVEDDGDIEEGGEAS